jgi:hypothetical protein
VETCFCRKTKEGTWLALGRKSKVVIVKIATIIMAADIWMLDAGQTPNKVPNQ